MQNSERTMIDDGDLELLEALLDNELTAQQSEQLRARVASEPGLAAELEHLRAERKLRAEMFSSLEGGEEAVVGRIMTAVRASGTAGPAVATKSTRFRLRYAMAAAALIAIGFLAG